MFYFLVLLVAVLGFMLAAASKKLKEERAESSKWRTAASAMYQEMKEIVSYCDYDFPVAGAVARRLGGIFHVYTSSDEVPQRTMPSWLKEKTDHSNDTDNFRHYLRSNFLARAFIVRKKK